MSIETDDIIEQIVEMTDRDMAEVEQRVEEKYKQYKDNQVGAMSDEKVRELATHSVRNTLVGLDADKDGAEWEESHSVTETGRVCVWCDEQAKNWVEGTNGEPYCSMSCLYDSNG